MAEVRQYLRKVRIDVLGPLTGRGQNVRYGMLAVEDLRIEFDLRAELQQSPNPSTVKIYNLRRESASLIGEPDQVVQVRAGYGDITDAEPLIQGDIRRVLNEDTGLDRVTTVVIGGSDRAKASTIVSISHEGPVRLRRIVQEIIEAMGLGVDQLDAIPEDAEIEGGYQYNGAGKTALRNLLEPRGLTAYEVGGIIHVAGPGQPLGGVIEISERTGMIGSPSATDTGARVKIALTGKIELDQVVEIDSLRLKGRFKVTSRVHRGDNWTGEFVTEIEAKALPETTADRGTPFAGRPEVPVGLA